MGSQNGLCQEDRYLEIAPNKTLKDIQFQNVQHKINHCGDCPLTHYKIGTGQFQIINNLCKIKNHHNHHNRLKPICLFTLRTGKKTSLCSIAAWKYGANFYSSQIMQNLVHNAKTLEI